MLDHARIFTERRAVHGAQKCLQGADVKSKQGYVNCAKGCRNVYRVQGSLKGSGMF